MSEKVVTRKIDWRTLCLAHDPELLSRPDVVYEFSNGRKFEQPFEYRTHDTDEVED